MAKKTRQQKRRSSVLVVAAHPDDEVLGCGGAVARHVEEGDSVKILIAGEGISSRVGIQSNAVAKQQMELRSAACQAAQILGASTPILKQLPDNRFDEIPLLKIIQMIELVIRESEPTLIYTHHASDVNVDHRILSAAIEAAARPMEHSCIQEVRAFEVPSSSEWNFTRPLFCPTVFVSLTERQLRKKIDAMRCYTSEIREFPHPRSPEYLESLARLRGAQSGACAAEAFALVYRRI
jgi:LmbE family N-acetylglucosaminyl deacetylase